MIVNPLSQNITNLLNTGPVTVDARRIGGSSEGSFADIFNESLNSAGIADQIDKGSSLELLSGQSDDLSGMLIDMQKAELSLQLALQIRNKVIDAYNEVLRMSV